MCLCVCVYIYVSVSVPDVELELLHGWPRVKNAVRKFFERIVLLEVFSRSLHVRTMYTDKQI